MRVITEAEERTWVSRVREIPIGGYCEFQEWDLVEGSLEAAFGVAPCPHATEQIQVRYQDGRESSYARYVVPRVVRAKNEGGYNVTTVCVDCILEASRVAARRPR